MTVATPFAYSAPAIRQAVMDVFFDLKAFSKLRRGRSWIVKLPLSIRTYVLLLFGANQPGQADAEHKAVYLESSSDDNNRFYSKFGFGVRKRIYLGRGDETVELHIMVREPVPVKTLSPATSMSRSSNSS